MRSYSTHLNVWIYEKKSLFFENSKPRKALISIRELCSNFTHIFERNNSIITINVLKYDTYILNLNRLRMNNII